MFVFFSVPRMKFLGTPKECLETLKKCECWKERNLLLLQSSFVPISVCGDCNCSFYKTGRIALLVLILEYPVLYL